MDAIDFIALTRAFGLGELKHQERVTSGWIQQTWRLVTDQGNFIAQGLHPVFDVRVTEDGAAVSSYLKTHHFPVPVYLRTLEGSLHLELAGCPWRVMPQLPGFVYRQAPDLDYLLSAGRLMGQMHHLLAGWNYTFQFQQPHFHDTRWILTKLQGYQNVIPCAAELAVFLEDIPRLLLPDLPKQVIHGDLKLANFLFEQGQATGIVDLDTLMYHTLCVELGDALRSWCTQGESFSAQAFEAGITGYGQTHPLSDFEQSYLIQGIKLITLELGMRYLIDWVEDHYFQWDSQHYPTRQAHNLARAQRQIRVYQSLVGQEPLLKRIVKDCLP